MKLNLFFSFTLGGVLLCATCFGTDFSAKDQEQLEINSIAEDLRLFKNALQSYQKNYPTESAPVLAAEQVEKLRFDINTAKELLVEIGSKVGGVASSNMDTNISCLKREKIDHMINHFILKRVDAILTGDTQQMSVGAYKTLVRGKHGYLQLVTYLQNCLEKCLE